MAFGQGKVSGESTGNGIKRYVGVASVKVLAVNPTMKEWNNITGGNMQKEPEYVTTDAEGTKQARITLLCEAVTPKGIMGEKNVSPTTAIIPVTFWFARSVTQPMQPVSASPVTNMWLPV